MGGEKFKPGKPLKDGEKRGVVAVELSNGITAKRIFTPGGSRLEISGGGEKSGQALLNDFISVFALDLTRFLNASDKEKATILLEIIGIELQPYEEREKKLYAERENVGRLEKKARGHAESLPFHEESGTVIVTAEKLMTELQRIVTVNGANRKVRQDLDGAKSMRKIKVEKLSAVEAKIKELKVDLSSLRSEVAEYDKSIEENSSKAASLKNEDEADIKACLLYTSDAADE